MLESPLLKILASILWSWFKNFILSFEKLGQWRRWWTVISTVPQSQIGFTVSRKLSLNVWNRRWLNPSRIIAISFKPLGLWNWKVLFAKRLMKANMRFLKSARLSDFLILESNLFHSVAIEKKKEFLK